MNLAEHESPNLIPPVQQPRGWRFFAKTWSGRFILVNALIFGMEAFLSGGALTAVQYHILLALGAKDPVLLAQGEWWRLVTPIFIHGNFLHFAFNNWALYVIAYQLEALLGAGRFVLLYLLAGIGGNIASALWSLNLSVGASGALFGLLGCAFIFERTIQSHIHQTTGFKPRTGIFTVMVIANILFGFIIPQIDNAAHIGGFLVGGIFAYILLRLRPNRLLVRRVKQARILAALSCLGFALAAIIASSPGFVAWRFEKAAQATTDHEERLYYLDRWLELEPGNIRLRWHHLELALEKEDIVTAGRDLEVLAKEADFDQKLTELIKELETEGRESIATWLKGWRHGV